MMQMATQAAQQGGVIGSGNTMPLSTLIDYIVQRTFQELNVLSELLPRKGDMERKIEIVQFASRTRQLFVRLLALVKWASSEGEVDKCSMISDILDRQAMVFIKTADSLSFMARDTLCKARLPSFSIPCAIDVLTTGTYPRLPACIKEKIIPPDPITPREKHETLQKLNQIIEHRLVIIELPRHMRRPHIYNGRVKFRVEHEFEVTLTLMGDGPNIPWRLLNIAFLVEDPETGGGMTLVHPLQVNYIHQLVQNRLLDNTRPLNDMYTVLHSFCQSLQLEVLHSQMKRLIELRLGDNVHVEEYVRGKSLIVSYWRARLQQVDKETGAPQVFKLTIHVDEREPSKPLQVTHYPPIQGSESTKVAQAIRSDYLSVEKLLINTVQVYGLAKLRELERELRVIVPGPCEVRDLPTVLYVPVLYPCMDSERLAISIDTQKGNFLVSLSREETELTTDIENSVNADKRDLRRLLSKLRLYIALRRCEKSVQHLQTAVSERLPLLSAQGHPVEALAKNKLFIKLPRHPDHYLIVEATETYKRCVAYKYYILQVQQSCFTEATAEEQESQPRPYLKPGQLVQLDEFACTHGSDSPIHDIEPEEPNLLTRKRKLFKCQAVSSGPQQKRFRPGAASAYFVPQLPHILALAEDRIHFIHVGKELEKRKIAYSDIEVDGEGIGLCLSVLGLLCTDNLDKAFVKRLQKDLLSCKLRYQNGRGGRSSWLLESIFCNSPLRSSEPTLPMPIYRVYSYYEVESAEKTVAAILNDWTSISQLFQAVCRFARVYNSNSRFQNEIEIRSYSYKNLVLAYGPNKCYTAWIMYKPSEQSFAVGLGTTGQIEVANCHSLVLDHLQAALNRGGSISQLAQLLIDTWWPFRSLGKLHSTAMLGHTTVRGQGGGASQSTQTLSNGGFTLIPHSATHIRLLFRESYCLDIQMRANYLLAVRDGSCSVFDTTKLDDSLMSIPGLKAFLNLFVDESSLSSSSAAARRRSTADDDHPPSPIGIDDMDRVLSSHLSGATGGMIGTGSPAGRQFKSPLTPMSNPASPSKLPHQSPVASFSGLTSPPSLTGIEPSPGGMLDPSPGNLGSSLHVPSPGSFVPAPSPSSLGIHMPSPASQFVSPQGIIEGANSPYPGPGSLTMPSPRGFPPSPMAGRAVPSPLTTGLLSPPSRMLPQRSYAASIPTMLSHEAFSRLLTPAPATDAPTPAVTASGSARILMSPLERFLSCVALRKHLQKTVQQEDCLKVVSTEGGLLHFETTAERLQCRVSLQPPQFQALKLKLSPASELAGQWDSEELAVLERFFELKAACPPYKQAALVAFVRMLSSPVRVLKDFVQVLKLELNCDKSSKWVLSWCPTFPHGNWLGLDVGAAAFVAGDKIVFVLRVTNQTGAVTSGCEPLSAVVPVWYNPKENGTCVIEQRVPVTFPQQRVPGTFPLMSTIQDLFKEYQHTHMSTKPSECSLFPTVRHMLLNLPDPTPPSQPPISAPQPMQH